VPLLLYKFARMRPAYLAFIAVVCLCYGCEKKKNAAPSSVTTTTPPIDTPKVVSIYPYTDTFYGVWYNVGTYEGFDGSCYRDTTFYSVCYAEHVTFDSMLISAAVTSASMVSVDGPVYFQGFNFTMGFIMDSANYYIIEGVDSAIKVSFSNDSLFFSRELSADCANWINGGSFAGKGNVRKH